MKNILYLSAAALVLISCRSSEVFRYTNECQCDEYFKIDSKSKLYARTLYLTEDNIKTTDSHSASNKENRLIELQFLVFNPDKEVLYITTNPSPKIYDKGPGYQLYSEKNKYPNSYVFNTFYFGELTDEVKNGGQIITFEDKRKRHQWNLIKRKSDTISLLSIDNFRLVSAETHTSKVSNIPVNLSAENVSLSANHGVDFIKVHRFFYLSFDDPEQENNMEKDTIPKNQVKKEYLVYNQDCKKVTEESEYNLYPRANRICLKYSGDKLQYLFIPFSMDLNESYRGIKFNSRWVRFERGPERRPKKTELKADASQ